MTDRLHQWNGATATLPLPSYLLRNEYLAIANNYRDNASLQIDVTLRGRALVYLMVDNRIGDNNAANPPDFTTNMTWVVNDGWTPVRTGRNRTADVAVPDLVRLAFGERVAELLAVVVAGAALSTLNATVFTGARTNYALGQDFRIFAALGRWDARANAPVNALLVQGAISLALVWLASFT